MNLALATVLLLLAILGMVLKKTYFAFSLTELKRRAVHDADARRLYRAAAYGSSLRTLLWLYIGLTSAASLVVLARALPVWLSLLIIGPLLWIIFSIIPASRPNSVGVKLTKVATPVVSWLLNYLHPGLEKLAGFSEKYYQGSLHTGLYEREDLMDLIRRQASQADSRLTKEDLKAVRNALRFSDLHITDVLTSRKQVKTVLESDTIGPVLIDELHKSEQPFALVRESSKGPVAGILMTAGLGINSSGSVKSVMYAPAYYLHEDDSLSEAVNAFSKTHQPVFVIVNSFEEYVGVVSVDAVLKKILGSLPESDFEDYTDSAAVAARHILQPATVEAEEVAETAEPPSEPEPDPPA